MPRNELTLRLSFCLQPKLDSWVGFDFKKVKWIHFDVRSHNVDGVKDAIKFIRSESKNKEVVISVELEAAKSVLNRVFEESVDFFFIAKQFALMNGWADSNETIEEASKLISGSATVISIWSTSGSKLAHVSRGKLIGDVKSIPSYPANPVIDTNGAGDTLLAATIFAMTVMNEKPCDALDFGSRVAAAKVSMSGFDQLSEWDSQE